MYYMGEFSLKRTKTCLKTWVRIGTSSERMRLIIKEFYLFLNKSNFVLIM